MESQVPKTMKEEQDDGSPQHRGVMDIKLEPVDEDVMDFNSSKYVMNQKEALVESLCLQIKTAQDSEQMSKEINKEKNLDTIETMEDMESSGSTVKGEEEDSETWMTPLLVPVEAETYSEGTSEEHTSGEDFEDTVDEDIQVKKSLRLLRKTPYLSDSDFYGNISDGSGSDIDEVSTGHSDFVEEEEGIKTVEASYTEIKKEPMSPLSTHSLCNESVDNETMDGDWQVTANGINFIVKEEAIDEEEIPLTHIKDETTSVSSHIVLCEDFVQNKTRDVNLVHGEQASTTQLMRYSENFISEMRRAVSAAGLNRHAVHDNFGDTSKADKELSMQCLNHRGKSHKENFKKSTASSSSCVGREVRGEYKKQDGNQLEMGRGISRSSGESFFKTQVNEESSKGEMQNSTSKGSCSKQSKRKKETKKPFLCSICGRCFQCTRDLEDHERIHTGDKPFQCAICNKKWTSKKNLALHMRVHSEERPYKCSSCEKSFKRSFDLECHMRVHTGQKPFVCNMCGKAFALSSTHSVHTRTHTGHKPYKCTECSRAFRHGSCLTRHMRTHSGEKPYKCTECGKDFSQSCHLTTHKRIHTCERTFACKICGRFFSRLSDLSTHRASVHGAASPVPPCTV